MSVTDLEIDEAIREAWTILYAGAPPSVRRLAAALLAVTGGTQAHPHWVTPDDLWRDRLAVLADQGAWLASWGPQPGEPDCRVPQGNRVKPIKSFLRTAITLWVMSARRSVLLSESRLKNRST